MNKNGIDHKDVPEHRLINPLKIAKENQPKNELAMWTWIKKNALKRLLPFVKEVIDVDIDVDVSNGNLIYKVDVRVLGEHVYGARGGRKL